MNKFVVAAIVLVLGVAILAGGFLLTNRPTSTVNPTASPVITPSPNIQSGNFNGTFLDLLSLGQNQMCTFDNTDTSGNRTEGTVYITADNKLRSDFTVHQTSGSFNGSIIRDGDFNYIWTTLQEQGVKLTITPDNESLFGEWAEEANSQTGLDDQTEVDFDCNNWTVDETKFETPEDVEFVDISQAFSQLQGENGLSCSSCEQLPEGDVRGQCLAALQCE